MSAYQVSRATIDLMVSAAIELKLYGKTGAADWRHVTAETAQEYGAMLWKANAHSVAYRYRQPEETAPYYFQQYADVNLKAALGCARCFDYQACEPDDYSTSNAKAFVNALGLAIAQKLTGEDAPWGVADGAEIAAKAYGRKLFTPAPRRAARPAAPTAPAAPSATVHQLRPAAAAPATPTSVPATRPAPARASAAAKRDEWQARFSIAMRPRR